MSIMREAYGKEPEIVCYCQDWHFLWNMFQYFGGSLPNVFDRICWAKNIVTIYINSHNLFYIFQAIANLIVPIHAYMVMNVGDSFPSAISFKPTTIGQR